MQRQIAGSRALVTGASSGIGRAIAVELARQRARLVALARREESLRELAAEVQALSAEIEIVKGDVTDQAIRKIALARAADRFGGLDILVNNAGVGAIGRFDEAGPERLRQIMEVNFFALAEMTRAALPLLRAGRRPIVVNIGSIVGHRALPRSSEYCASKFAVRGLSESLRAELAPQGIDVLVVSPATTESEFQENLLEQRGQAAWRANRATPADTVARRTVRAIQNGRRELFPDLKSRLIYWLNRVSPALVERAVTWR